MTLIPQTQASLTCHQPVFVRGIAALCYPLSVPDPCLLLYTALLIPQSFHLEQT